MHKQAAINTAKTFIFVILGTTLGITALELLTPTQIAIGLIGGLVVFMINLTYSIEKSRLETMEKISKIGKETV